VIHRATLLVCYLIWALTGAAPTQADEAQIKPVAYTDLLAELNVRIDFDGYQAGPEPGLQLDRMVVGAGATLSAKLAGQRLGQTVRPEAWGGGRHYNLAPGSTLDLPLRPGGEGTLVIAEHRGFGSNALFPVGPDGAAELSGRGEGALNILFEADQPAIGLRVHSDYPDPLGLRPPPGMLTIYFFNRSGMLIDVQTTVLDRGITELGYRAMNSNIAAVSVTNTDPGGIAIDDILFQLATLTS
jgi:hypothetical protein